MRFKNSRLWCQHAPWVVARDSFLILLVAFLIRYGLHELIEPYGAFHFFMVGCVIVAVRYGYRAAFSCLVAGYLLGSYFFVHPYGQFGEIAVDDLIKAFDYFIVTSISILLIEKLQRTIYSQKLLIHVMRDSHRSLLYRQNELLHQLRQTDRS